MHESLGSNMTRLGRKQDRHKDRADPPGNAATGHWRNGLRLGKRLSSADSLPSFATAPIEIGCCRFRRFKLLKSGMPDFSGCLLKDEVVVCREVVPSTGRDVDLSLFRPPHPEEAAHLRGRLEGWHQVRHLSCPRVGSMSLEDQIHVVTENIVEFVRAHEMWAAPVVGVLAFGESLAFISLLLPAWAILVALGTVIGKSGINFWPILVAGAVGAALGDWLSYWVGVKVGPAVAHTWPLSRNPGLIPRGERFVAKWGALGIFIGRFSGPLRAAVPLVAGIFLMPYWHFQTANFLSAFVWVAMLLTLGDVVAAIFTLIWP